MGAVGRLHAGRVGIARRMIEGTRREGRNEPVRRERFKNPVLTKDQAIEVMRVMREGGLNRAKAEKTHLAGER